jgi:tellurite resistance protein TehA-like permease
MRTKPSRDKPDQRAIVRLVADLPSSSFAFVMATGIISIAGGLLGFGRMAALLLAVNSAGFLMLWILTILHLIYFPSAVIADLCDHRRGPGFLTVVAATNVLGDQIGLLTSYRHVAAALWLVGCALWLGLSCCLFTAFTTRAAKPSFSAGLDGTWLLIVVAPESSAILGAGIAGAFSSPEFAIFTSLTLYLLGGAFYGVVIAFILYRWLFEPMAPDQLTPTYWINMGAAAIATLAGARLLPLISGDPALAPARGFVFGETVMFWSIATWWIPLLIALTLWRHRIGAIPLSYHLENWSIVFPLGMYTAATWSFSQVIGPPCLTIIPSVLVWIAIAAWCVTFVGMIRHLSGLHRSYLAAVMARRRSLS